ncbi:AIPR family protein [Dehalococcoides mccartyi]|uniref:AIPR family protein n=1 Tax=Dehalococcoides mccartyi TaxID=61435 RepID=UPI0006BDB302|nr:AIPR family protein [Dehalococcoides mccartyi]QYY57810.1 AIPR family protein [Dehalococcoides mccartyi]BAS32099.1 hypothetical protein IBK_1056 [Dehalococcoides mccartyi IBARAKI]BEL01158.1 AIPR family protein [Dehalococcoides mccartyi]
MSDNDRIILNTILENSWKGRAPDYTLNKYFETFVAENILKNYDLSDEEIGYGQVGNSHDGGIDSLYAFVNGNLIDNDTDPNTCGRDLKIELFIIQSKMTRGFTEDTIMKFMSSVKVLFNLSETISDLSSVYNDKLLELSNNFREFYCKSATKFPSLKINFIYATIGDEVHPSLQRLVAELRAVIMELFSSAEFKFDFRKASDLLELTRQQPKTSFLLKLAENPISSGDESFICLVALPDYYKFIIDENRNILRRIFESNIRDYQGNTQVNQGIRDTLQNPTNDDFWWLNNGVTIIASRAWLSGKTLTIENPLIVNGLQTSHEIFRCFTDNPTKVDTRNILVRIIGLVDVDNETQASNRIIRATNSQTAIQISSLRATDSIQRNIEDFFMPKGYYYDRRKNYYKNLGKPIAKIISITYLAQSVIAILLRRPNDARARPSSLLKNDSDYDQIFGGEPNFTLYLKCIQIMKQIESFLSDKGFNSNDIYNYKYHLGMYSSLLLANNPEATSDDIAALNIDTFTDSILENCNTVIKDVFNATLKGPNYASKDKQCVEKLIECLKVRTFKV